MGFGLDGKVRRAEAIDRSLFVAIDRKDLRAVQAGMRAGASPNAFITDGETVLMHAVKAGSIPIVLAVVKAGANPKVMTGWGFNAIDAAKWNENSDPRRWRRLCSDSGFHRALCPSWGYVDRPAALRLLLAVKAPIDATALNRAIESDRLDCLRLMLAAKAPVNGVGTGGHPLHVAAANGKLEAVRLLLAHGARRNLRDDEGLTAAEVSRRTGNDRVATLLGAPVSDHPRLADPDLRQATRVFASGFSFVHDMPGRTTAASCSDIRWLAGG